MVAWTALSTRLSMEVRIHFRSLSLAVRLWSESTPMTYFCLDAAAESGPAPPPPAHGGEDPLPLALAGGQALVGVDPDDVLLLGGGGRDHPGPGAAGGVEDHVSALTDLLQGQLLALGRVAEGLGGVAGVVDQDLDLLAVPVGDVLDARLVAGLELLDQVALKAADEAAARGLGLE